MKSNISLRDKYLKEAQGVLCVFSIDDESGFQLTQELHDHIVRVKGDNKTIPIILVGNKSDLCKKRVVPKEQALFQGTN